MRARVLADCVYGKKGDVVEIPDKEGVILEHAGIISEAIEESEVPVEDIDEFLKASSTFVTADNAKEGDILEITGKGYIDKKTFDKANLIVPVRHQGNDFKLRLGPKNAKRIADSFGTTKLSEWVGRRIEVIGVESYKGLGTRGLLLRGCKEKGEDR